MDEAGPHEKGWHTFSEGKIILISRPSFRESLTLPLADVWLCGRGSGGSASPLWHRVGRLNCFVRPTNALLPPTVCSSHIKTPNCVQLLDCHQTWSWPSTFVQCADLKKSLFILTTVATARWCSILSCNDNKYRNNVTLYLLTNVGCNQKGERIHKSKSMLNIRT